MGIKRKGTICCDEIKGSQYEICTGGSDRGIAEHF
jgi:hypothetical protein